MIWLRKQVRYENLVFLPKFTEHILQYTVNTLKTSIVLRKQMLFVAGFDLNIYPCPPQTQVKLWAVK
jgi:hypothetical protein